jgi:presenilin-like A22 family membrane protease
LILNIILVFVILSNKVPQGTKNIAAMIYGGGIGTLLGTALPLWTGLLMVMGISMYDIYSVRSGPIKEIVKVSKEQQEAIPGLSYVSSDWEIGLGDLGIYSMLVSLAQTQFGLIACMASIIGVLAGSLLTLQLLKKREFLPGLPITSLIGAIPIVIFMILSI